MKIIITPEQAITWFNMLYEQNRVSVDTSKKTFYCGITNDIQRRENEHNAEFLQYVKCENKDEATELERLLGEEGFDIGRNYGNGASDDSIYTYIYMKTDRTKEHL